MAEGYDIAARMAEVVGQGPRIEALADDELDGEVRELCDKVRAGAGAGPAVSVPEYMRTIAKHPALFRIQMEAGAVFFNGRVPKRERELAVLRVGWLCGAPYEWGQHVEIGKRVGLTSEEIERVTAGSAAPGWTAHEAAILRAVEELIGNKAISGATWDELAQSWDEQQLLEFPAMVGQYVAVAFIQNSVRSRMEDVNPGLSHR